MADDKPQVQSAGEAAALAVHENNQMTEQVRYEGAGIIRRNPDDAEARVQAIKDAEQESADKFAEAKEKRRQAAFKDAEKS